MNKTPKILFVFAILLMALAACQSNGTPVPQVDPVTVAPLDEGTGFDATNTPEPSLSYKSATYTDEMAWIALDYPEDWTEQQSTQIGERGWQGGLFSPGSSAELIAEGGARVMITLYTWEPVDDIEAYTAQRKLAWDASGFIVLEESTEFMTDDRAVVTFVVETSSGDKVVYAFLTTGDDYLEISGEGDLDLCREIIGTIRPID
jgi:hypothetical protein